MKESNHGEVFHSAMGRSKPSLLSTLYHKSQVNKRIQTQLQWGIYLYPLSTTAHPLQGHGHVASSPWVIQSQSVSIMGGSLSPGRKPMQGKHAGFKTREVECYFTHMTEQHQWNKSKGCTLYTDTVSIWLTSSSGQNVSVQTQKLPAVMGHHCTTVLPVGNTSKAQYTMHNTIWYCGGDIHRSTATLNYKSKPTL